MSGKCFNKSVGIVEFETVRIILIIGTLLIGLYHEPFSCVATLLLLWAIWIHGRKEQCLMIRLSLPVLTSLLIVVLYALSVIWAVDKGMAAFGFVKFLPLPLFAIVVSMLTEDQRASLVKLIPWIGAAATILSGTIAIFPQTAQYVLVNGRLAGTFQYPNTFALFLLVGVIQLMTTSYRVKYRILGIAVLFTGIAFTGSRTVFILFILTIIVLCIFSKEKHVRVFLISAVLILLVITLVYAVMTGDMSSLGRYLTISLKSSTLQGRLLYWQDAIPVILRHPFGLGYMGYNCLLGSFQTGVYSLTHVHNEILQLMLDIGWIPGALLIYLFILPLHKKTYSLGTKLSVMVIFLHSMMDFSLQFPVVWFVLLLYLTEAAEAKTVCVRKGVLPAAVALGAICLYFGVASLLYYAGCVDFCTKVYPVHTKANIACLQQARTPEEMNQYADRILLVNQSSSLAWSAKARVAYASGNFEEVIRCKEKSISLSLYNKEEYLDYFEMLWVGYQLYTQNGDISSAEICQEKLLSIPQLMNDVQKNTSDRAWMIDDKPDLELPAEYVKLLQILADT